MNNDEFIALSDERDLWMARLDAAEKAGYERGYQDGWDKGREDYYSERWDEWHTVAPIIYGLMKDPRSYQEMNEARYGPGGWLMAGVVDDGDYTGGPVQW